MTPSELCEWRAYLEGIGDQDDEQLAATQTAAIVNELRHLRSVVEALAGHKSKDKAVTADDYVRRWRDEAPRKRKQSAKQAYQLLKSIYG